MQQFKLAVFVGMFLTAPWVACADVSLFPTAAAPEIAVAQTDKNLLANPQSIPIKTP